MTAAKEGRTKQAAAPAVAPLSGPQRGISLPAIVGSLLLVGGFVLLAVVLWRQYGQSIVASPEYTLRPEDIEITKPPAWIKADVKQEVLKGGLLQRLDLADPKLTVQLAQAFELHPWVAQVSRASKKFPAGVMVEIVYRRPLAMVEVTLGGQPGLLPIDGKATLLPPEDFSPADARSYLRIAAGGVVPSGSAGSRWTDERIAGAAAIAALVSESWQSIGLYRIVVHDSPAADHAPPSYELLTRGQLRIAWGHAPSRERSGEATAHEKLSRLHRLLDQFGSLEGAGMKEIDLREAGSFLVQPPLTSRTPSPAGSPASFIAPGGGETGKESQVP